MSEQISADQSLKRLEIYVGLARFIVGTVVLGFVSAYLNHQYQTAQLELEKEKSDHAIRLQDKEAEFEYLSSFIEHAMNEDLEVRIRLANYMQSAALSDNIKQIWRQYHDVLVQQRDEAKEKKKALEEQVHELSARLATMSRDEEATRKASLDQIEEVRREIYYLGDQIDRRLYGDFQETYVDVTALLERAEDAYGAGRFQEALELQLEALSSASDYLHPYILNSISATYRALKEFDAARRYAQRAVLDMPANASFLYQLAITQKNDGDVEEAIQTLQRALEVSDDSRNKLNYRLVIAGYLVHAGRRAEGMAEFEKISDQVEQRNDLATNLAWFRAVAGPEEEFYQALERALRIDRRRTMDWLQLEIDLDKYRDEARFKQIVSPLGN